MALFLIAAVVVCTTPYTSLGSPLHSHSKHDGLTESPRATHGDNAEMAVKRQHTRKDTIQQKKLRRELLSDVHTLFGITQKLLASTTAVEQMSDTATKDASMSKVTGELESAYNQQQSEARDLVAELRSMESESASERHFASASNEEMAKQASQRYLLESQMDELQYAISKQRDATASLAEATTEVANSITRPGNTKSTLLSLRKSLPNGKHTHKSSRVSPTFSHSWMLADEAAPVPKTFEVADGFQDSVSMSNVDKSIPTVKALLKSSYGLPPSPTFMQPVEDTAVAAGIETAAVFRKTLPKRPVQMQVGANETAHVIYFDANKPVILNKVVLALVEFLLLGLFGVDRCVAGEKYIGIVKGLVFTLSFILSGTGQYLGVFPIQSAMGMVATTLLILMGTSWFLIDYFGVFLNMMSEADKLTFMGFDVIFTKVSIEAAFQITLALFSTFWFVLCCTCTILLINLAPRDRDRA